MKLLTLFAIALGAFSGFIYSNGLPTLENNINIFYIIAFVMSFIFLLHSPKNTHFYLKDFIAKNNTKFLGILSSFALFILSIFHAFYIVTQNLELYLLIVPALSLLSSLAFAKITLGLDRLELTTSMQSLSTAPVFLLTAELLLTFRDGSTNPILSDFVIVLLAISVGIVLTYMFSSLLCTKDTQVFLNGLILIFLFFIFALGVALLTSYLLNQTTFYYSFDNIRIFTTLVVIYVFFSQYSSILSKD